MALKQLQIKRIENAFIYFLLLQPILDVLAYFDIPISLVVRFFVLLIGVIYLMLLPKSKQRKTALMYFFIFALFMLTHFCLNWVIKTDYIFISEVTLIIKTIFFIEMLILYFFILHTFSKREKGWQLAMERIIFINMSFIGLIMLIADITGTEKRSYDMLAKEGHSGWFFAANELSAIMAMGFCIMILYMLHQKILTKKIVLLPFILIIIWSMLTVGTKVGLGAVIITFAFSIFVTVIEAIKNKRKWVDVTILIILSLVTIIALPNTAVGNNLNLAFSEHLDTGKGNEQEEEKVDEIIYYPKPILSGRSDYFSHTWEKYKQAPISQKVLGLGAEGESPDSHMLIEMDFFDWYFSFGMLGIIVLLFPLIYLVYKILASLFKTRLKILNQSTVLVGVSVCLGLGTAFVAGHVLSSPAVSIYLAVFVNWLFLLTKNSNSNV
ncbi:O-antigen ligase family protein [Oceanobacillus bengalensis]|uniref:O-antigen ligase domain-containing protein n=1 Tax=Oceanobacillus bengalensis TaxID=1435466 RepID=A0A494YRH9_9BACI|nr:O-antigen ligase family protein [Oceanobacillus bengalensis]RKQ11956.1 hypothetical protein D8M05_19155 [Oceanobacillus bengalensis]